MGAAHWDPNLGWCTKLWFTKAAGVANSRFTKAAGEANSWFTKAPGEPKLSDKNAKNCKEPCIPPELPKCKITSRCGGVA